MINNPLISIVIPCYNAEQGLEKCLDSVVRQHYQNLEIVIVDDGSEDGSSIIYDEFQKKDKRIKIIKQKNSGVSKARNVGVEAVTGEYICFVDADDWVEPEYCTELYHLLVTEKADIAIIEASYENEDGVVVFSKPVSEEKIFDGQRALILLLEDEEIQSHPWGKLYKTHLLKNIYFSEHLKCFEDYSTLFKIFNKAIKVAISDKKLYHYIQRDDSLSHNMSPENAYLFFLALMEVFNFWEQADLPENQNKIIQNIIRKLLMVLKRILRNTENDQMLREKEEIRVSFKPFLKYSASMIGVEYYSYLRLYYYYPTLFAKVIGK